MSNFKIEGGTFHRSHFGDVHHHTATEELEAQLAALRNAVGELSKQLPVEQVAQVRGELEKLEAQVSSAEPSRKWYDASAEGIISAATAVAGMVEPVSKAVNVIGKILFG